LDLKRNIEINNLSELVTIHECALGATEGEVGFTIGPDTINRVTVEGEHYCRTVHQKTLDFRSIMRVRRASHRQEVDGMPALTAGSTPAFRHHAASSREPHDDGRDTAGR
jgi:hypothetical protein